MHGVCHIEWEVSDIDRAQKFFASLFNWKFESFGDSMVVFGTGDKHIGGLSKSDNVKPGTSPTVWIEVEEIEPYLAKATAGGGSVITEKRPVPHVGFSAELGDPDGNRIGIVQFVRE